MVLQLIGERQRVLDVGCGSGGLARILANRECDIVGIDRDPLAVEEARRFCAHAFVADLDAAPIGEVVGERTFDTIVLADVLGYLREPTRVLDDCRALLAEDGAVVASIANGAHGSIRLALYAGAFADPFERSRMRFYSAKSLEEMFVQAGFRIERIERATAPIDRANAPAGALAEIEADPECETLSFVVRATPLSNEAKYRAISKRFLLVSGELAAANQKIAQRDRELAGVQTARTPDGDARQRQLLDGLRRALDEAIVQHDIVAASATSLKTQLEAMTENRDEHVRLGQNAADLYRSTRDELAAAVRERTEIAARGGEIARELERTRAERDAALADRSAIDALEAQLASYATRVGQLQDGELAYVGQVDALNVQLAAYAARIGELQAADLEHIEERVGLSAQVETYAARIGELQEREVAHLDQLDTIRAELAGDRATIEALDERIAAFVTQQSLDTKREHALHATIAGLEIHIAGYSNHVGELIDAHDHEVAELRRIGQGLESEVFEAWQEMERLEFARNDLLGALAEIGERFEDELERSRHLDAGLARLEAAATEAAEQSERNEQLDRDLRDQVARADAREAELCEDIESLRSQTAERASEIARLGESLAKRTDELKKRSQEAALVREELEMSESRLVLQAEALSEATEAESRRLATLIDAVQSGPYWSLKRLSDRFWGSFRR